MAAPTCTFCGEYQSVFMGTSMEDGETFCACGICLPGVMLGMTAALVTGMPADEAQSHAEAFDAILSVYTPAQTPPKRSGKRSGPSAAKSAEPDQASGPMPGDQPLLAACPGCEGIMDVTAPGKITCTACGYEFDPAHSDG